eukprot:2741526-Rhodomonas_salina.2
MPKLHPKRWKPPQVEAAKLHNAGPIGSSGESKRNDHSSSAVCTETAVCCAVTSPTLTRRRGSYLEAFEGLVHRPISEHDGDVPSSGTAVRFPSESWVPFGRRTLRVTGSGTWRLKWRRGTLLRWRNPSCSAALPPPLLRPRQYRIWRRKCVGR